MGFNPDQPRDDHGKWEGDGSTKVATRSDLAFYQAETTTRDLTGVGRQFAHQADAEHFAGQVLDQQNRSGLGDQIRVRFEEPPVKVPSEVTGQSGAAFVSNSNGDSVPVIWLGAGMHDEASVLHELTHIVGGPSDTSLLQGHGPDFQARYDSLLRENGLYRIADELSNQLSQGQRPGKIAGASMTPSTLSGTLPPGGSSMTITTEPAADTGQRQAWKSPLIREGQRTGDGRLVRQGATVWGKDGTSDTGPDVRELPLPFYFQRETPQGGLGGNPHAGAVPVGAMTHVWRDPQDPSLVMAAGWYDDSDDAREAARMADNGMVSGVSADLDDCDGEPGEDGGPEWTHARLMGATQVPFPALPGSKVSVISPEEFAELATTVEALATTPAPSSDDDAPPPASGGAQIEPHDFVDDNNDDTCDVCNLDQAGHDAAQATIKKAGAAIAKFADMSDPDDNVKSLAQAVDAALDAIRDALTSGNKGQVSDLLTAAENTADQLIDAVGGVDADEPAQAVKSQVAVHHVTALEALTAAGTPQPWGNETWFQDPDLKGPTPLTVTDEVDANGSRRIFGHAFCWGTPHTALGGTVTPPKSKSGYAYFMLHSRRTACDCPDTQGQVEIPVGYLTFGTTHFRNLRGTIQAALDHYDHSGYRAAAVAFGEDDHGGWFAGATDPALDDQRINDLYGATLSGDWRWAGGNRELVALLGVNVPGFPVPRGPAFHLQGGRATALVAAGILMPDQMQAGGLAEVIEALESRVAGLETERQTMGRLLSVVEPKAREQLMARLQIALPDLDAYERGDVPRGPSGEEPEAAVWRCYLCRHWLPSRQAEAVPAGLRSARPIGMGLYQCGVKRGEVHRGSGERDEGPDQGRGQEVRDHLR